MNAKHFLTFGLIAALASACGSDKDSTPAGPTSVTLSCSFAADGFCTALTGATGTLNDAAWNTACTTNGGAAGTSCPTANRVGVCTATGGPPTTIFAYYSPAFTAATGQADCLAPPAGTWTPG